MGRESFYELWCDKKEFWNDGNLDWLLEDDPEVVEMLDYERKMLRHHSVKELLEIPTSLAHQALRQDPALYMMIACCMKRHRIVATPFKGEGTIFGELDLDDPERAFRVGMEPTPPIRPRLTLEWSGLTDDAVHVVGPSGSSLARYAMGHAQWAHDVPATTVQLRSVCPLASALLCQLNWNHPSVIQNCATLFGKNANTAEKFILGTRVKIIEELKVAYRELTELERFWHGDHSYSVRATSEQTPAQQPSAKQKQPATKQPAAKRPAAKQPSAKPAAKQRQLAAKQRQPAAKRPAAQQPAA